MNKLRVLVACEFSGIVRDAFAALGHDAWSCDLLPSESVGTHLMGDVTPFLGGVFGRPWDLMVAHPPCTYLSYCGGAHWNKPGRAEKRAEAMRFFMSLVNAPIERIAVENPWGLPSLEYRMHDQEIQPYYFGDNQRKRTCLWLKNLPRLHYVLPNTLFAEATCGGPPKPSFVRKNGKKEYFVNNVTNHGGNAGHPRSKNFPCIAAAMARQWSDYC